MSYTLNNLKAAKEALLDDDIPKALEYIDRLIARMETILQLRENWKPKCKELPYEHNGSTESGAEEPLGKLGHTGDNGLLKMGEQVRRVAGKDGPSPAEGENS